MLLKHRYARSLRYDISEIQDGTRVKEYCDSYQEDVNKQLTENSDVEQHGLQLNNVYNEQQKKSQTPYSPVTGISGFTKYAVMQLK